MRFPFSTLILASLLVIFTSCAHLFGPSQTQVSPQKTVEKAPVAQSKVHSGPTAIWYLYSHDKVTLYFRNVDNGSPATMIIERGLTRLPITAGHWELTGYEEGGNSFASMNTSKKFVFRVRPKSNTYAGSIVIGCPKVGSENFKYLKGMKFFNRYPFNSSTNLCEMIVGNDFAMVRTEFKKTSKNKGLTLSLGF